jgi:hypothetical protein
MRNGVAAAAIPTAQFGAPARELVAPSKSPRPDFYGYTAISDLASTAATRRGVTFSFAAPGMRNTGGPRCDNKLLALQTFTNVIGGASLHHRRFDSTEADQLALDSPSSRRDATERVFEEFGMEPERRVTRREIGRWLEEV